MRSLPLKPGRLSGLLAGLLLTAAAILPVRAQEFRGLWVDTFHPALRTSAEVSQLVAEARAGHFNAVVVEVRKRGDAYYRSSLEPKAADVSPASFDPLADLLAKAHDTSAGPRLEVHAWIVTYNIWNNRTSLPPQADHPFRLHPEWLTESNTGEQFDGSNYAFDPGHPDVQRHTFAVAMDLINRYDLDGFHLDYIRYAGPAWGYHAVALERFRALHGRTGTPSTTDAAWMQFRRDQVTDLLRKIYLSAIAAKPGIKISAATITFAPGITADSQWPTSAAYNNVLQDWRAWMQEGILDLNCPMAYFRQETHAADWTAWSQFIKNHRYQRHAALGSASYLNSVSNAIRQIRSTRVATSQGNVADGVLTYSYAVSNNEDVPRAEFLAALVQPSAYDTNAIPVFPSPTNPPVMPWKTTPTLGHLKGEVVISPGPVGVDGAAVQLEGPASRSGRTDATGFYGWVELPPGDYTVTASQPGFRTVSSPLVITAGAVTHRTLILEADSSLWFFTNLTAAPGLREALLAWETQEPAECTLSYGLTTNLGLTAVVRDVGERGHETLLSGLTGNSVYYFRLGATQGTNQWSSEIHLFRTAGEVIVDNPSANLSGSWTIGTSSTDKFRTNYHYAGVVSGTATATATFAPLIETPGLYDVFVWYPQGASRSAAAPFVITDAGGTLTVPVDQTTGGGGWRWLAAQRAWAAGSGGTVRLANNTGESGRVVMADGMRWVYVTAQDRPAPGSVPLWWATHYFGGPTDAALDPDGDGASTYAEYVVGTSPIAADSRLALTSQLGSNDSIEIRFHPFHAGRSYQLEARTEWGGPGWVDVVHSAPSADGAGGARVTDSATGEDLRFYRLRVSLPP